MDIDRLNNFNQPLSAEFFEKNLFDCFPPGGDASGTRIPNELTIPSRGYSATNGATLLEDHYFVTISVQETARSETANSSSNNSYSQDFTSLDFQCAPLTEITNHRTGSVKTLASLLRKVTSIRYFESQNTFPPYNGTDERSGPEIL